MYVSMDVCEYGCMGVCEYGCMGVCEYGCMGVWVYGMHGVWCVCVREWCIHVCTCATINDSHTHTNTC